MPPARTGAEAVGPLAACMATDGIGTLGLTPIHLSRTMEFSSIRSAGASTPRALRLELRTLGTATVTGLRRPLPSFRTRIPPPLPAGGRSSGSVGHAYSVRGSGFGSASRSGFRRRRIPQRWRLPWQVVAGSTEAVAVASTVAVAVASMVAAGDTAVSVRLQTF